MNELAWFAAGVAAAVATTLLLRTRGSNRTRASVRHEPESAATVVLGPTIEAESPRAPEPSDPRDAPAAGDSTEASPLAPERDDAGDARTFAMGLAEELATLACGVEGSAHALIECAPHREMLPAAAEGLLNAIHRLRTLHRKLLAYGKTHEPSSGSADLDELITGLTDELQHMQLGIELDWEPHPGLPRIAIDPEVVREALLFLCSALLRVERGATRLSIAAELCMAGELPTVHLELAVEWAIERSSPMIGACADVAFSLEHEAAVNLLSSQGADVVFTHLPGHTACAVVCLPVVPAAIEEAAAERVPAEPVVEVPQVPARHHYGGALVLEADPSIRAMLASELKATGRAVFSCADGASARSFLAATPERFELLIVDHHHRLEGDDELGETIRSVAPRLKICVLGPYGQLLPETWPRLHRIEKPFGVHELRTALASVLAGG